MKANQHLMHPRVYKDKKPEQLPLTMEMGSFFFPSKEEGKDRGLALGIFTSQYFKLLKALIQFMIVAAVLHLPLFYFYGQVEDNFSIFTKFSLGNLGQNTTVCALKDFQL